MDERNLFAAAALVGLLATHPDDEQIDTEEYAEDAWALADAMLSTQYNWRPRPDEDDPPLGIGP